MVTSSSKYEFPTSEDELADIQECVEDFGISGREALVQGFFELKAAASAPVRWTEAVDVERKHPSINEEDYAGCRPNIFQRRNKIRAPSLPLFALVFLRRRASHFYTKNSSSRLSYFGFVHENIGVANVWEHRTSRTLSVHSGFSINAN